MGLLNTLDRYLPDEQVMSLIRGARGGLSGFLGQAQATPDGSVTAPDDGAFLRHHGVPQNLAQFGGPAMVAAGTPAAGASGGPAYDKSTDGRPGFWSVVDGVLGGETISEARESIRKRELARRDEPAQEAARARVREHVASLPLEQQAVYYTKPDAWADATAENYKPRTLSGGQTERRYGEPDYTAPVLGIAGDQAFTQGADTFTVTGRRDPTFAETSEDTYRTKTLAQTLAELQETSRANRAREGLGWAGIGVDRERLDIERSKTGGLDGDLSNMSVEELINAL